MLLLFWRIGVLFVNAARGFHQECTWGLHAAYPVDPAVHIIVSRCRAIGLHFAGQLSYDSG